MSEARDEVLARVRRALAGSPPPPVTVPRGYRTGDGRPPGDPELLDQLVDRLEDHGATVHRCDADVLPATIARVLLARGTAALVIPHPSTWLTPSPARIFVIR